MDEHCRITVVGERRQVDLAVPAGAPIITYVDSLARMCGQQGNDLMPAAWTLAGAVNSPFAPEQSLAQAGVVDGQVLYLCDVAAHEFAEPVLYDVSERVAELAEGALERRWDVRARVVTVLAVGLAWLLATMMGAQAAGRLADSVLSDLSVTAGLLLPALAWAAGERRWPVPRRAREALALAAVPLLALGARAVAAADWAPGAAGPAHLTRGGFLLAALAVGALVGAILAYLGAFGVTTGAVLTAAVCVAAVGTVLAMVGADLTQTAAVAAVVSFVLLTFTVPTASGLVGYVARRNSMRQETAADDAGDPVAAAVAAAKTLLVAWTCFLAAVLAAALVVLAADRSRYGVWLAVCMGGALLMRAGSARLVAEVVPVGAAGAAGLCMALVLGADRLGWSGWTAPGAACLVAVGLLVYGFRNLVRNPDTLFRSHPGWMTTAGSVLGGGGFALALATFGAYGWFVHFGRGL